MTSAAAARCIACDRLAQRRRVAQDPRRAATRRQLLLEQRVLAQQPRLGQRAVDDERQVIGIDGLGQEVERAVAHRRHGILDAAVGGHHHHGHGGVHGLHRAQHAEAVAGGQPQVGDDDVGLLRAASAALGVGLVAGLDHGVAVRLEGEAQHRAQRVAVLDDEHHRAGRRGVAAAQRQRSQPAGTPALRASSSMSLIALVCAAISRCTRSSSATAFRRFCSITARCAGSSRLTKSAVSASIRDCSASAKVFDRSSWSRAAPMRSRQ